jgi:hypothetical protein
MDYKRIYDELIADRLHNPPAESEYTEKHHILPRSIGGTDDPSNLVYHWRSGYLIVLL